MSRSRSSRTSSTRIPIPAELAASASALDRMRGSGLLNRISKVTGLSRRHGYDGGPLTAFFIAFLLRGAHGTIAGFAKQHAGPTMRALAALAGFRALPAQASVSRCLRSVTTANVHAFADALLCGDVRTSALLAHPAVHHRDAHGRSVHVFDLDPTITAYRQRGLPEGDDLPAPKRFSPGKPGYTGHHRGDVRTRIVPVRHAGSGLWLGCRLIEGSESALGAVSELVRVARSHLPSRGGPPNAVLRMDGEFGSVGALRACIEADVAPVARLSRYGILDAPSVEAHLRSATWTDVPDSGSGPRRSAADLGLLTLRPDGEAERAEEGPIEVRVVVTRFGRSGLPDHGVVRDGFQYELIATTLTDDAWPAEHVAALFFGRAAMENAFAQEDREFGTDRTFSYNAPGQAWVTVLAQLLSNRAILDAEAAHPLSKKVPPQARRTLPKADAIDTIAVVAPAPVPTEALEPAGTPEPAELPETKPQPSSPSKAEARGIVWGVVASAFADLRVGWVLDPDQQEVRCPRGWTAVPSGFGAARKNKRPALFLRVSADRCRVCPMRLACLRSSDPSKAKRVGRSLDPDLVDSIQKAIDVLHQPVALRPVPGRDYEVRNQTRTLPQHLTPGPWLPDSPLFLPGTARRIAREASVRGNLVCHLLPTGVRPPRRHPLLAGSVAERQRRRQSWTERRNRWESSFKATLAAARPR